MAKDEETKKLEKMYSKVEAINSKMEQALRIRETIVQMRCEAIAKLFDKTSVATVIDKPKQLAKLKMANENEKTFMRVMDYAIPDTLETLSEIKSKYKKYLNGQKIPFLDKMMDVANVANDHLKLTKTRMDVEKEFMANYDNKEIRVYYYNLWKKELALEEKMLNKFDPAEIMDESFFKKGVAFIFGFGGTISMASIMASNWDEKSKLLIGVVLAGAMIYSFIAASNKHTLLIQRNALLKLEAA